MAKLNVAYVTSEVTPFSKTGGLADVAGSLPQELAKLKQNVVLISPRYSSIDIKKFSLTKLDGIAGLSVWMAGTEYSFGIYESRGKLPCLKTYFVDCPQLFDRKALYVDPGTGKDYPDNDIRFAVLSRAALLLMEKLGFKPDIIHANDWQTALIPAYLKTAERDHPFFAQTKTMLTIHNVAYQGMFPAEFFDHLGINRSHFYPTSPFEFWGRVNFLKAGIVFADVVTTVSETYAKEIQSSEEYGFGLEGVLHNRKNSLFGVVNGVDYEQWSPENDALIPLKYGVDNLEAKLVNKAKLLKASGLKDVWMDKPLIGVISRLADQKGFDLLAEIANELFKLDLTFVLLGTGEKKYHQLFEKLQKRYSGKVKVNLTFDNRLAHLIEAGADIFLMPSRYEPCGLNQLYSLKYGTVPVARKTGGLADTIVDEIANRGKGTGFLFEEYSGEAFFESITDALNLYANKRSWSSLMKRGMKKDFSWNKSAKQYIELYGKMAGR